MEASERNTVTEALAESSEAAALSTVAEAPLEASESSTVTEALAAPEES